MTDHAYRPDVDGLRAVAVGLVLLFHGNLLFPGGFVGVDVFFVISGFLITGLILKQQRAGTFSLKDFWIRRIRRILPASLLVTAVTLAAGALLLFPDDYKELAQSALAQLGVGANVFFWRHTGYFGGAADLKPLLHTWSLAVEEQFYLIYPFLLILMRRLTRPQLGAVLTLTALVSLGIAEWGFWSGKSSAVFYLLPPRAWEMLLGGLICFLPARGLRQRWMAHGMGCVGLAMILWSAVFFMADTRFPGFAALVPCFGAALLIYSNSGRLNFVGHLLALRPIVFVGLISYSLYLWHWPLFAYTRYWMGKELSLPVVLTILGATFVLALLTWRWIETPFRRGTAWGTPRQVVLRIAAVIPVLAIITLMIAGTGGWKGRFPEQVHDYLRARNERGFTHQTDLNLILRGKLPTFGDPNGGRKCLLWGDSHAMALGVGLDAACKVHGIRGFQATYMGTPPTLGLTRDSDGYFLVLGKEAPIFNQAVVDFAVEQRVDIVVLGGLWSGYAGNLGFEQQLSETLDTLIHARILPVIVLDVAWHDRNVPIHLAQRIWRGLDNDGFGVTATDYRERNQQAENIIRRVAWNKALVVDPSEFLANEKGTWLAEKDGKALYFDQDHLSVDGSRELIPMFDRVLLQVIEMDVSASISR